MNLLKVTEHEWTSAETFFRENPTELKLNRQAVGSDFKKNHSFIQIEKTDGTGYEPYAIANRHITEEGSSARLGEGGFAKVKVAQNKQGENFALKVIGITVSPSKEELNIENEILQKLHYMLGSSSRDYPHAKAFLDKPITLKKYVLMKLIPGRDLYVELSSYSSTTKEMTTQTALIISLKICEAIKSLHEQNIIHADIKPENFMIHIEKNNITLTPIDFGLSLLLPQKQSSLRLKKSFGTMGYMAPEVLKTYTYSFSSDIYALGIMFTEILPIKDIPQLTPLMTKMLDSEPSNRPSMARVISDLNAALSPKKERTPTSLFFKLYTWMFQGGAQKKELNINTTDKDNNNKKIKRKYSPN